MPTYDYECQECGHTFERFQSIKAGRLRKCPECGRMRLRRLIGSGAAVIFKGSGFYQTDYRSAEYKRRSKEDASAKSDSGSGDKKKSDSDPGSGGESKGAGDSKKTEKSGDEG